VGVSPLLLPSPAFVQGIAKGAVTDRAKFIAEIFEWLPANSRILGVFCPQQIFATQPFRNVPESSTSFPLFRLIFKL